MSSSISEDHIENSQLVSVIVPVYNVAPWLRRSVGSIMKQTYSNLEIILVDDGSTDESGRICDLLAQKDNRIRVIHTENRGLSDVRNLGLKVSTGDYITYIDSDDRIDENYIELLYNAAEQCDADMTLGKIIIESKGKHGGFVWSEHINSDSTQITITNEEYVKGLLTEKGYVSVGAKFFKRSVAEKCIFPSGRLYEDMAVSCDFIKEVEKIVFQPEAIYYYQIQRPGSITGKMTKKANEDYIWALKKLSRDGIMNFPKLKYYIIYYYRERIIAVWKYNATDTSFVNMLKSLVFSRKSDVLDVEDASRIKYMALCRKYIFTHLDDYMKMSYKRRVQALLICFAPWLFRAYGLYQKKNMDNRIVMLLQNMKRVK